MYPDRFASYLDWQKLLFLPDRRLQVAELNELQTLLNYQATQAFSYLFSGYKITSGLKISFSGFTSIGCQMTLSPGQVYIELPNQLNSSFFLDIQNPYTFVVPYLQRVYLGINPQFYYQTNLQDPLMGDTLCGDLGADRLVANPIVTTSTDSFPIAVLQGRTTLLQPTIYYYENGEFTLQYSPNSDLPTLISNYLALRNYEESGNFIASGLYLSISTTSATISPGYGYVNGSCIELPHPYSYLLSGSQYSFYLSAFGAIVVQPHPPTSLPNALFLGYVEQVGSSYYSIPTSQRDVTNADLLLLSTQNVTNQLALATINLNHQVATSYSSNPISGIFTDSFNSLNNSDINAQGFSASIVPTYELLRTLTTPTLINFSNLTQVSTNGMQVVDQNSAPYYLIPTTTTSTAINQNNATAFLTLSSLPNTPTITVNPPGGQPDTASVTYQSISTLVPVSNLTPATASTTITVKMAAITVTLSGYGFPALDDNISITFGSTAISQFTITDGSQGTNLSTIKADASGSFTCSFLIPSSLNLQQYTITASDGTNSASCLFQAASSPVLSFSPQVAQTFQVAAPLIVSGVNLAVQSSTPLSSGTNIALVSLVTAPSGIPTSNVLGQGILTQTNITTSVDGSAFSTITFNTPTIIPSAGTYALVITALVQPLSLYYANAGDPSLSSTTVVGNQPLVGGSLLNYTSNQWVANPSQDLTFQLLQLVPNQATSSIIFQATNPLAAIDYLTLFMKEVYAPGTNIQYSYLNSSNNWIPMTCSQPITGSPSSVQFQITFTGTSSLFPLILLNQSTIQLDQNSLSSTWISITTPYTQGYTNVEVAFTYYLPSGATITPLFSSNAGQTWESLTPATPALANGNIPLYTNTWTALNITPTISSLDASGNSSSSLRNQLTLKIVFSTSSPNIVPFVSNLKAVVY